MEYPQMIYNNKLTEAGQEIVTYIESTIEATLSGAGDKADALNRLPGHIKHYYVNVLGTKSESPAQFVENYERSSIKYAWNDMVYFQEQTAQAEKVEDTVDKTSKLGESLNQLMEELQTVKKELATEKGRVTKLSKKLQEAETVDEETDDDILEANELETDDDSSDETDETTDDDETEEDDS